MKGKTCTRGGGLRISRARAGNWKFFLIIWMPISRWELAWLLLSRVYLLRSGCTRILIFSLFFFMFISYINYMLLIPYLLR